MKVCENCGVALAPMSEQEEAEARSETQAYWPGVDPADCALICDKCWQAVDPEKHPEMYAASLRELDAKKDRT